MTLARPNLLVTGGAGFIGSTFVEQCLEHGHQVWVLDKLTYAGHRSNLDPRSGFGAGKELLGKVELIEGDINDRELVAKLLKQNNIDGLVHFAAESHVDRSIAGPQEFINTNVLGTFTLLEAALEFFKSSGKDKFRFLQVSTDEVYGSLGSTGLFSEHSPFQPNSPYSASKASADHLVRAWHHTFGLPVLTTNCSNNYGPRQHPEKLIPHMITCALGGKPLPVYGDGQNIRDWIHVEDHSRGVYQVLQYGKVGETYCLGGSNEIKNIDLVVQLCQILDRLSPREDQKSYRDQIQFVTDRLGHDRRYAIDSSKAKSELGFDCQSNFEQGLTQTIQWVLDHQEWCQTLLQHSKDFFDRHRQKDQTA